MRRHAKWPIIPIVLASGLAVQNAAMAETTISAFENFNLDGLFPSWSQGTAVSQPTGYSITASGYGSGYKAITPALDATGETNLELTVTLSGTGGPSTAISGPIVSLVDADGTFYNYAWYGQTAGTHVLRANLSTPTFTTAAGSAPGLDLSHLAFFHLQDDPGSYSGQYTITFNLLRLTGAPLLAISSQTYEPNTQQFTISWASRPGKTYTIMFTSDLSVSFSPLSTGIPSDGNSTTNTVSIPSGQSGFLRVQQE